MSEAHLSSGGKTGLSELDAASNACLELCSRHGFATGHGDTVADIVCEIDAQITERLAAKPADEDHPDCVTDRECELYDALMGLASHATAYHGDYKQWTQGGVSLEPIVTRALRLSTAQEPKQNKEYSP